MAAITAALVKELREKTGAGMMDCKAALKENDGDMEAAVDWLRKKGLSKAAKKAGRTAADGLVAVKVAEAGNGAEGVLVEVNAETDFVARNEVFQKMVGEIANQALAVKGDVEALRKATYPGGDKSVDEHIAEMVGQIGENMSLRRADYVSVDDGVVVSYVHTQITDNMGKIGVLVALKSGGDKAVLNGLGRQIAMHVAASRPLALTVDDLDSTLVEREKSVLADQARASGKPEAIIEKMVEGRLRKYYEETVLMEQIFVMDNETKIGKLVENAKNDAGAPVELVGFVRMELGEGIEQDNGDDFAAEVAAMAKG